MVPSTALIWSTLLFRDSKPRRWFVRQNILLSGYSVFTNGMVSIKIQNKQGISFEQANGKI
jgi:hypothetical protein